MWEVDKMGFLCDNHSPEKLPDVTIYGGDTAPWNVNVIQQNGNPFPYTSLSGATALLTFTPYAISMGLGGDSDSIDPILSVDGTVEEGEDSGTNIVFNLTYSDTVNLRGKYVYQIEISKGNDRRVLQGFVTIKQNINRSSISR